MTVNAGVASIKGVYHGEVALSEPLAPESFTLKARGQGAPGTVDATVQVRLSEVDGGTRVDYDAQAVVGGMIGGVGQRMLTGVSKRMADEFFANVEAVLAGGTLEGVAGRTDGGGATVDGSGGRREAPDGSGAPPPAGRPAAPGTVYTAPAAAASGPPAAFTQGVVLGAAAALAGALVGAWISRRAGRG
jgi:hypothetical protein